MQQGPFSGVFKRITGTDTSCPPALAVSVTDKKAYRQLVTIIQREAFIRVRQMDIGYRRLVLNTVGDAPIVDKDPLRRLDYSQCELNMSVTFTSTSEEVTKSLDNSPVWQFMFVNTDKTGARERLAIVIDKETEEIKLRKEDG